MQPINRTIINKRIYVSATRIDSPIDLHFNESYRSLFCITHTHTQSREHLGVRTFIIWPLFFFIFNAACVLNELPLKFNQIEQCMSHCDHLIEICVSFVSSPTIFAWFKVHINTLCFTSTSSDVP